ncbi:DUF58 domain-containing protein [Sedimenticola sp.]|uniref:DUF58 domain-containing protein n=1 Tax=Sedimenticola sp. TaxID=1940285 RepID=UPI003D120F58
MTPSRSLLWATAGVGLPAAVALAYPALHEIWLVLFWVLCGMALLDGLLVKRAPVLTLERTLHHSIPVGVWSKVGLTLGNPGARPLNISLHDHHPSWFDSEAMPYPLVLPAQSSAQVAYRVKPQRRGDATFSGCDLVLMSPLGFWRKRHFYPLAESVKVFPNFQEIGRYALLATDHRLSQMGVRRRQRRGQGNDFHQLRDYRAGDALRQIDWKASSRYRKLISKEYQDERDQQVLFLLDCGRRMRHEESGRVHFDQALNALLLLAHVAAQQGDAVGLLSFGGVERWLPPHKGSGVVKELLSRTYDLSAGQEAADFLLAAKQVMSLQPRRALVVLMTNTRDEDHDDLIKAVQLLKRRHLVVVANLRETILDEVLERPVHGLDEALQFHTVNEYLDGRRKSLDRLRHQGVLTLDLQAPQLPVALVNSYLMIKASGSL